MNINMDANACLFNVEHWLSFEVLWDFLLSVFFFVHWFACLAQLIINDKKRINKIC